MSLCLTVKSRNSVLDKSCKSGLPSGAKNYTYGQSDLTIDLQNNPELLAKFIKPKGWKVRLIGLKRAYTQFELFFRLPEPLDLNRVQKLLIKLLLFVLISIDWYLTYCAILVTIFHVKKLDSIILILWFASPNFVPCLWAAGYQLLYVRVG